MREKTVKRYYCDFCRKGSFRKSKTLEHEQHCYKNPDRVPWLGEVTSINSEGHEIAWDYPGPGKIWDGSEWKDVPHYSHGAVLEYWPIIDGTPLKDFRARERLVVLFAPGAKIESSRDFRPISLIDSPF